jgi:hypothetical protein
LSVVARRIGTLIWVLIYGGLFGVGLGIALARSGAWYGWAVICAGMVCIVVGCVLVWVRSRMPEP